LAALVMSKLEADALILLTDVDGLFRKTKNGSAIAAGEGRQVIALVAEITAELRVSASGPSAGGRGGMVSKLEAAQIAMRAGGVAVIANGTLPDTLNRVFAGEQIGTAFVSSSRMNGKRRWIAYAANVRGRVVVNAGTRDAILRGKASLLASGVIRVERDFASLDVVSIAGPEGREFARGMANCASAKTAPFVDPCGEKSGRKSSVLVTRDNMVITERLPENNSEVGSS
jgi:glutamate 5-kinase